MTERCELRRNLGVIRVATSPIGLNALLMLGDADLHDLHIAINGKRRLASHANRPFPSPLPQLSAVNGSQRQTSNLDQHC